MFSGLVLGTVNKDSDSEVIHNWNASVHFVLIHSLIIYFKLYPATLTPLERV